MPVVLVEENVVGLLQELFICISFVNHLLELEAVDLAERLVGAQDFLVKGI